MSYIRKYTLREFLLYIWLLVLMTISLFTNYPPIILLWPVTIILEAVVRRWEQNLLAWAIIAVGCFQMYISYY